MAAWKFRGLRGSDLENLINCTNEYLRKNKLALIQKIPTPITPIRLDGKGHITLAYFEQKSTVDYLGSIQGIPVCFDAKECKKDTFPLSNIHEHQMEFMHDMMLQGGIAFFLLYFTERDLYYYLRYEEADRFWKRMEDGGRKSFRLDELDERFFLHTDRFGYICFLEGVNEHLQLIDAAEGDSDERSDKEDFRGAGLQNKAG